MSLLDVEASASLLSGGSSAALPTLELGEASRQLVNGSLTSVEAAPQYGNCIFEGPTCELCVSAPGCGWCASGAEGVRCFPAAVDTPGSGPADADRKCETWVAPGRASSCPAGAVDVQPRKPPPRPPSSDEECYWDFTVGACAWPEYCEYEYKFGNVAMSQSCRLKSATAPAEAAPAPAEPMSNGCYWDYEAKVCLPQATCKYDYKFGDVTLGQSCRPLEESAAAPVDCEWDYAKARCTWPDKCEYHYVFGDLTLSQSCREICPTPAEWVSGSCHSDPPTADEECGWNYVGAKCQWPDYCEYHFKLGDLTLDQSCRLLSSRKLYPLPVPTRDQDCTWDYQEAQCKYTMAYASVAASAGGNSSATQLPGVCEYRYMFGDVTLSQSCRLADREDCEDEPTSDEECMWDYQLSQCACQEKCEYRFELGDGTFDESCRLIDHGQLYPPPAPTSDEECTWDYQRSTCKWPEFCTFKYCLFDLSLDESCRLKSGWAHQNRSCAMDRHSPKPAVDADCRWDYRDGVCMHNSTCHYQYCFGDMTLDESCRITTPTRNCNRTRHAEEIGLSVPSSDDECTWDSSQGECAFLSACKWHYCFGDMSLGESCRLLDINGAVNCSRKEQETSEEVAAKILASRKERLRTATVRRKVLQRKSGEESKAWQQVLQYVRQDDTERKQKDAESRWRSQMDQVAEQERVEATARLKEIRKPTDAAPAVPAAPAALATVATGGELHPLEPGAESEEQGADALRDHQLISACGEKCAAYKGTSEWALCLHECRQ